MKIALSASKEVKIGLAFAAVYSLIATAVFALGRGWRVEGAFLALARALLAYLVSGLVGGLVMERRHRFGESRGGQLALATVMGLVIGVPASVVLFGDPLRWEGAMLFSCLGTSALFGGLFHYHWQRVRS